MVVLGPILLVVLLWFRPAIILGAILAPVAPWLGFSVMDWVFSVVTTLAIVAFLGTKTRGRLRRMKKTPSVVGPTPGDPARFGEAGGVSHWSRGAGSRYWLM